VAATAVLLAALLGFSDEERELLHVAGNLHDLGKLAVPAELLEKPGALTETEFEVVQRHPRISEEILSAAPGLERVTAWASQHHERLDGKGYPFALRGEQISLGSRIMAVADVFTALAEDRPYRKGLPQEDVAKIMRDMSKEGKLDGDVVETLLDYFEGMNAVRSQAQAAARRAFDTFYRGEP
jgi:HD-GYP domain-containing protein (c-di-GMP phosphodiesterase class II)